MKPLWTADELAAITGARWQGAGIDVAGVAFVPSRAKPGDLFIDIKDDINDVAKALSHGASAALVSKMPSSANISSPILLAPSVRAFRDSLATAARSRANGKFIGITGVAGKTFTKDTLFYLLSEQAPTHKTYGNDNDWNGVAITLANTPPEYAYNVIEISMASTGNNVFDSVSPKSKLAKPHIAIITCIGADACYGEMYSAHNRKVAATKGQIFDGLEPGGAAIINRDDDQVFECLIDKARLSGVDHVITFGQHAGSDIKLINASRSSNGFNAEAFMYGKRVSFELNVNGRHLIYNALAALGAVHAVGANVEKALNDISKIRETPGRGNRYHIAINGHQALLLDYTRNGTLPAMQASLRVLLDTPPLTSSGRRIAVLSDISALHEDPTLFHIDMGRFIGSHNIDLVFATGEHMKNMFDALPEEKQGGYVKDIDELKNMLTDNIMDGDVILLQGWRMLKLDRIVRFLTGSENYLPWNSKLNNNS